MGESLLHWLKCFETETVAEEESVSCLAIAGSGDSDDDLPYLQSSPEDKSEEANRALLRRGSAPESVLLSTELSEDEHMGDDNVKGIPKGGQSFPKSLTYLCAAYL